MDRQWLDETNPNSLIFAILKCLEACPIDIRRDVVHHLVFCGDALVCCPTLSWNATNRLAQLLRGETNPTAAAEKEPEEEEPHMATTIPVSYASLAILADSVRAISTAPLRPDHVAWVGASLWATVWYHQDDQDALIKWIFAPNEEE